MAETETPTEPPTELELVQAELAAVTAELETTTATLASTASELDLAKAEVEITNTKCFTLSGQLAGATAERDDLVATVRANDALRTKLQTEVNHLDSAIQALQADLYEIPPLDQDEHDLIVASRRVEIDEL
ncbi:MAG: hypothetical protein ACXQTE_05975, partial [Methanosarcinaceae archaeon]